MAQPELPVKKEIAYEDPKKDKLNRAWWLCDEGQMHSSIWGIVKQILQNQNYQTQRNVFFASLYQNQDLRGFGATIYATPRTGKQFGVTWNVVKAVVDTATAKVGTEKPRPYCLTDDENWMKQKRAQDLSKYLEGMFDRMKVWPKGRTSFRDGCNLGTGILKFHNSTGKVCCDRIIAEEFVVDVVEGMYGEPRTVYHKRYMVKEVVQAMFPEYAKIIGEARDSDLDSQSMNTNSYSDMILVIEAWHLPSGEDATDGKHAIIIENKTLEVNPWNHDWFPFVLFRYTKSMLGFYGQGLAEEVSGIQLEINKMLRTIAIAQHLVAQPTTWVELGSKVPKSAINNEVGGVRTYVGQPPITVTPTAMTPEIYNYLETLWNRAFEIPGVSQMAAQGRKESGVNSGVAMRTLNDIQSDRFKTTQQAYEEMYIEACYIIVALEEELHQRNLKNKKKGQSVKVTDNKSSRTINWADVRMDLEDYSIRLWPTNLLPSDPAGKLQASSEMMQAGMLTQDESISLLDYPDLQAVTKMKTAPRDYIMRIIGNILDKGIYETPEPNMDLDLAKNLTQLSYLKARNDNVPQDKLDLILAFQEDVMAFIDMRDEAIAAQQQQALPPPGGGMPPDGSGLPPDGSLPPEGDPNADPMAQAIQQPVSDLLPVA